MKFVLSLAVVAGIVSAALSLQVHAQDKRVLIVMTSTATNPASGATAGYDLKEVVHPYYVLLQAGWLVDFASPQGGEATKNPASVDMEDKRIRYYVENDSLLMQSLQRTMRAKDVDPARYDAVLFAGGTGALWDFRSDPTLGRLAAAVFAKRGILATLGEGAAVLLQTHLTGDVPIYRGIRLTCATDEELASTSAAADLPVSLETAFREGNAIHFKVDPFKPNTIVEHRLITGQNSASALGVAQAIQAKWNELSTTK
jgi:putative intracellular protease/amidase